MEHGNPVTIDWNVVAWSLINFLVLLFLLRRFAWDPIVRMLREREDRIASDLERAENAREAAVKMKEEHERALAEANRRAEELLDRAARKAEELRTELVQKAQAEAAGILQRAEATIAAEREQAIAELREHLAELAVLVAEKVLERNLAGEDQERLARQFLREVGELQ